MPDDAVEKVLKKNEGWQGATALRDIKPILAAIEPWSAANIEQAVKGFCEQTKLGIGKSGAADSRCRERLDHQPADLRYAGVSGKDPNAGRASSDVYCDCSRSNACGGSDMTFRGITNLLPLPCTRGRGPG